MDSIESHGSDLIGAMSKRPLTTSSYRFTIITFKTLGQFTVSEVR